MKSSLFLIFLMASIISLDAQEAIRRIRGKVTTEGKPLKNVNIRVKNISKGVLTNAKGTYEIEASVGSVLVFSYVGLQAVEVTIDAENNVYNLKMSPEVQELDEVVVKRKRPFTQKELLAEYPTNKNLIKTSWGILDKDRASHSMRIIDGSEILPTGHDFLTSLRSHFPNMRVFRDTFPISVYFPNAGILNPPPAIFDVDGFIYEQAPTWIVPAEIDRIAVMKRNGAIIRYGNAGVGGVIIINTKEKTRVDELGVERVYDNADLMDSLVGQVIEKRRFKVITPNYIDEYKALQSEKKALDLFSEQQKRFEGKYYYFLDMSEYFRNKWGNERKAQEVLEDLKTRFSDDAVALRALAYRYEEIGQNEKALEIYLKILRIKSREAQSYRNVANAYNEVNRFQRALSYYARFETAVKTLDTLAYDKYGADFLMTTESDNILRLHESQFEIDTVLRPEDNLVDQNVRLLFEWNRPNADLKLRVVSPDDYYDEWEAPSADSIERTKGYLSKQFFLDQDFKGEWQIHCEYFGDQSEAPTYLKVTAFFDYGLPTQSKQSKVFKLYEEDVRLKLLSVFTQEKFIAP